MALSPTGIIPEQYMVPAAKGQVIDFLKQLPVEGDTKVDLLVGWARAVGASVNASQRDAVRVTGVDR